MAELALGTVQFGLDYGINNKTGQSSRKEVNAILQLCRNEKIHVLDTAYLYGESEEVLGSFDLSDFRVISKLPDCVAGDVSRFFNESLKRLNLDRLHGYLIHHFTILQQSPAIWDELSALKDSGQVDRIGCSLYHPNELETLWEMGIEPDIIQIPYNIFDRRFEPCFAKLADHGTEVHSRSAFLQGLFFQPAESLNSFFEPIRSKIAAFHDFCSARQLSLEAVCLRYCLDTDEIDHVVIGVDTEQQLASNILARNTAELNSEDRQFLDSLKEDDENMILPSNWKLS